MQHQKKRGKIFVKQFFRIKTHFLAIRGCFSQMFVLQKEFLFARGLNWDQSCLWKTPPSHFLLFCFFLPLLVHIFFIFFHLQIFGELRKLHAKIYTFSVKIDREINFRSWLLFYCIFHPCRHFAIVQCCICRLWAGNLFSTSQSLCCFKHQQSGWGWEKGIRQTNS